MDRKNLQNKPLVEAIFELRWEYIDPDSEIKIDPNNKIIIGRLYDKVSNEYPLHEPLPTASMPDEIGEYIVQHRFRKGKEQWPLIQIGPGIVTLNDTEGYVWEDFEKRIHHLLDSLFEVYPDVDKYMEISGLLLRYIDAVEINYEKEDAFTFLKKNLKVNIDFQKDLFKDTNVGDLPLGFDLRFTFPSHKLPKGAVHLRFVQGKRNNNDALLWETQVQSIAKDAPKNKEQITAWIDDAHTLTHNWFFKMIEGELLRRFE